MEDWILNIDKNVYNFSYIFENDIVFMDINEELGYFIVLDNNMNLYVF